MQSKLFNKSLKDFQLLSEEELNHQTEYLKKVCTNVEQWCKKSINCLYGCANNCIYCYARSFAIRFDKEMRVKKWKDVSIKEDVAQTKFKKVRKKSNAPYDIMFQSSTDIPQIEPYFSACMTVLDQILQVGNRVLITSKPKLTVIKKICERFTKYKDQIGFRFSISTANPSLMLLFEPDAPSLSERIKSLKYATQAGFPTSVSAEPYLDSDPTDLIDLVRPHLSKRNIEKDEGSIWLGLLKIRYIPLVLRNSKITKELNRIKKASTFKNVFSIYRKYYDDENIEWKDSILSMMNDHNIKIKMLH